MADWDKAPEDGASGHWLANLPTLITWPMTLGLVFWPRDACMAAVPMQAGVEAGTRGSPF